MAKIAPKLNKVSLKMSVATSAGNLIKLLLPAQDPTGSKAARIHHFSQSDAPQGLKLLLVKKKLGQKEILTGQEKAQGSKLLLVKNKWVKKHFSSKKNNGPEKFW